jgi:MFS superfamily sulfate permease-like transporter
MKRLADLELPSNRRFGLLMAAILAALAVYLSTAGNWLGAALAALLAVLLASFAIWKPDVLIPLNRGWMALGALLGMVFSPIVLGILFFVIFAPVAVLMRMVGRDELRLRRAPADASYWRIRTPPGPQPDSFRRQF